MGPAAPCCTHFAWCPLASCHAPAAQHFLKWGCWWNRDIERMVRQAGLQIDSMSRWHFGTTYMLVARPSPDA
jgi:methyltransferase OMS1